MMMNNNNKASSSSSSLFAKSLDSQVIVITDEDENMTPPPPPPLPTQTPVKLKRQQRKVPLQVGIKKMLLPYDRESKNVFFGYKMHYLSRPQQLVFNSRVKLFQCNSISSDMRLGVANIDEQDRISLAKMLNNVAGSLPVVVKKVRRPMEEEEDDVLFVTIKQQRTTIFDHRGSLMAYDKMPKVCDAKIALTINGMKVKDDEASFIMTIGQIMVKKGYCNDESHQQQQPTLLFNVSDDDEGN